MKSTFRWSSSVPNQKLNSSFYLAGKPAWFGNLAYPAFGPDFDNPSIALVRNIPAKHCYDLGQMPNCLSGDSPAGKTLLAPTRVRVL